MLAIVSLEIARDSVAQLGIGLLPFSYVGILVALLIHIFTRSTMQTRTRAAHLLRSCNSLFWIMLLVGQAIKAASAKIEENMGYLRSSQQAKYPVDDTFVDNLTMACVDLVLAILEHVAT